MKTMSERGTVQDRWGTQARVSTSKGTVELTIEDEQFRLVAELTPAQANKLAHILRDAALVYRPSPRRAQQW